MRHYEIVILVHPDQSEQVPAMIERYRSIVESDEGRMHRIEDWGRRQLAYPVARVHKAHYVLMNVECGAKALNDLKSSFRFSDAVLRDLILACREAPTGPSLLAKQKSDRDEERHEARERSRSSQAAPAGAKSGETPPAREAPAEGRATASGAQETLSGAATASVKEPSR